MKRSSMINILNRETIDKIAAGEVVERPESVVKELLENAIDSGADSVSVEIREGGLSLIRVTDNGCGIEKEDIPLAFLRHATSKLASASDLLHIRTMGFRGEALASISGVSEVEMITKTKASMFGCRYRINGGQEQELTEIGAPEGTTVIVRNLFYNVPARKKFLKSPATEGARIADIVEKTALSHPGISFRLSIDGRNRLHTAGNGRLSDVVYTIYGREVTSELLPIDWKGPGISITGLIGKPVIARAKREFEIAFINGRYIRSHIIEGAVEDAFRPYMMLHRFPFALLQLTTDPEQVDVNVHPKKLEVRFSDTNAVYRSVYQAVTEALQAAELITSVKLEEEKPAAPSRGVGDIPVAQEARTEPFEVKRSQEAAEAVSGVPEQSLQASGPAEAEDAYIRPVYGRPDFLEKGSRIAEEPEPPRQEHLFEDRFLSPSSVPSFRMIGQLFETYWLIEFSDKLYIIDQHAAHEKVNYERTMRALREKTLTSQNIFPPIRLKLRPEEAELVLRNLPLFQELGYEMEDNGDRELLVRAVPADLYSIATKELLTELLDGLSEDRSLQAAPDILRDRIASMSCKAAVKGNQHLSQAEMEALIGELLTLENPYACPHGRPTIISMSRYELDKKFKRIL